MSESIHLFARHNNSQQVGNCRFFESKRIGFGELLERRLPTTLGSQASAGVSLTVKFVSLDSVHTEHIEPSADSGWLHGVTDNDSKSREVIYYAIDRMEYGRRSTD